MISHITFASLPVTELDRALAFWRDVMGMALTSDDSSTIPGMRWIMLRPGVAETQIHLNRVDKMPETQMPALPLIAPDVEATVETLRAKGVEIISEPKAAEWNAETTYAMIHDSEGNIILIASN